MSTDNQPKPVSTLGWDTVNAISYTGFNKAIGASKKIPADFKFSPGQGTGIEGKWEKWRLVRGGSGQLLQMQCDIASGTITQGEQKDDLAKAWVKIQIRLKKVEQAEFAIKDDTADPKNPGKPSALQAEDKGTSDNPAVTVIATSLDTTKPGLKYALNGMLGDYFSQHIGQFTDVFHVAMLNSRAAKDAFQWLKPTLHDYAVIDGEDDGKSIFGVLCMTEGRSTKDLGQEVDARLFDSMPGNSNSVIAISAGRITEKMLLPAAAQILDGSDEKKDFTITSNGLAVTNNKDLTWQNIKLEDGETVSPLIKKNNFRLTIEKDQFLLEFTDMTFNSPNYTMPGELVVHVTFTQRFYLKASRTKKDGLVTFTPVNFNPMDPNSPSGPNLTNFTVQVVPNDAARAFEDWMIGIQGALAAIGVLAAGFKAGTALARWASGAAKVAAATGEAVAVEGAMVGEAIGEDLSAAAEEVQVVEEAGEGGAKLSRLARFGMVGQKYSVAMNRIMLCSALQALPFTGLYTFDKLWVQKESYDDVSDVTKIPALNNFAANLFKSQPWPNTQGWDLMTVGLSDGNLLLFGDLQSDG